MTVIANPKPDSQLKQKTQTGDRLRILFINDVGFQYGAGLAMLRQIQSFLLMGHDVAAMCCIQGQTEGSIPVLPPQATGQWLGMSSFPYLHPDWGFSLDCIIDTLVFEARIRYPDLIIVGNLHGTKWPLTLLSALQSIGCPVIAYMHDCYLFTGRCAYTGDCTLYETGCDDRCPTWQDYPVLEPHLIFNQWVLRRQLFCGAQGIRVVTNSEWVLQRSRRALKGIQHLDCVYLGLDEQLFRPMDKTLARQILGIPLDRFVILSGSANVTDRRKGGHLFNEVVSQLGERAYFLVFGAESRAAPGIHGTGLLRDYRRMALVYSAADLFVGTALEEAFGQTLCEASACEVPIVAFDVGGVSEIARHDLNARLVEPANVSALLQEIEEFMADGDRRHTFGQAGRSLVEAEFTLRRQGERWMDYVQHLAVTES